MKNSSHCGWLAFDVGGKKHAWASKIDGKREHGAIANDPEKLRTFLKTCLKRARHLKVLVEATGVYYLDVAILAHELGAKIMAINPRTAHHFAKAFNQRNKTDTLDAEMLLECAIVICVGVGGNCDGHYGASGPENETQRGAKNEHEHLLIGACRGHRRDHRPLRRRCV